MVEATAIVPEGRISEHDAVNQPNSHSGARLTNRDYGKTVRSNHRSES